eukprot:UN06187
MLQHHIVILVKIFLRMISMIPLHQHNRFLTNITFHILYQNSLKVL